MEAAHDPLATKSSFCSRCGALLALPDADDITCGCCGAHMCYGDLDPRSLRVVTTSEPRPEPLWAKKRLEELGLAGKSAEHDKKFTTSRTQSRATVAEICPKCGHHKASFYTMQLRSVDEGQTVFYECLKCQHTWSQNN
jgi:DNA-directed RNA polymerase I subunit RPA12